MQSGHIFEENEAFNWSQKFRFFRANILFENKNIHRSRSKGTHYKLYCFTYLVVHFQQWKMTIFFSVLPQGHIGTSWFFIHYRKSVTSNTFQFRDDSESKSAINKMFCGYRLHWFKKINSDLLFSKTEWNYNREREKSKYLDSISVLPTSIFIFDKFVDGAQPEVAGRWHILRTLHCIRNLEILKCSVCWNVTLVQFKSF